MNVKTKYNVKYFNWYKKIGEFGAVFNKKKFSIYIKKKRRSSRFWMWWWLLAR